MTIHPYLPSYVHDSCSLTRVPPYTDSVYILSLCPPRTHYISCPQLRMSSLSSSHAPLSSTPPSERAQSSLSLSPSYLPTALAQSASSFLRRFYTEPTLDHLQTQDPNANLEGQGRGEEGTYTPPPRRRPSPFQPPPLRPLTLRGLSPTSGDGVTGQSVSPYLLSRALAEEIRLLVPPRLQLLEDWQLIYSLDHDGVSLATLYKKCEPWRTSSRRGYVVVVKDANGGV